MNRITEQQTLTPFFEHFFSKHPIKNDVFVIKVTGKYFFFETDNVIDMIKNFSIEHQKHIKRQLQFYNYLNQDLTICLMQIASDYIRGLTGNHKKNECKILPLHSFYPQN